MDGEVVDAEAVVARCGLDVSGGVVGEVRVKHSHHRLLSAAANERKRESYLNQACGEDLVQCHKLFAGRQAWQRL